MSRIQLRVQDTLREQIEEQADRLGISLTDYVVSAISERLQRDINAATQIELLAKDREWFFSVLDDRSELPKRWDRAAANAKAIAE